MTFTRFMEGDTVRSDDVTGTVGFVVTVGERKVHVEDVSGVHLCFWPEQLSVIA